MLADPELYIEGAPGGLRAIAVFIHQKQFQKPSLSPPSPSISGLQFSAKRTILLYSKHKLVTDLWSEMISNASKGTSSVPPVSNSISCRTLISKVLLPSVDF